MSYNFHEELQQWCIENNISRTDLIAKLQLLNYEEFQGLDSITLSRWITGKTTPALYKQFLIAKSLDVNLMHFILKINSPINKCSSKISKLVTSFIKVLDFSFHTLSYTPGVSETSSIIEFDNYSEHIDKFGSFYRNISPTSKYIEQLYLKENDITYTSFSIRNQHSEILAHWVGIEDLELINGMSSFISIPANELAKSCVLNIGYFRNSRQYFELIIMALCYYILSPQKKKEFAYIYISGTAVYELTKNVFNAEDIRYYPPIRESNIPGVHLVKVNIMKNLVNPVLLPQIKNRLHCLNDGCINDCKYCNLKEVHSMFK